MMARELASPIAVLIPLGISQLCFFDAEKVRFLAEDETSMQALGGAIKSLLGLDLAERLLADAAVLEGRIAKRAEQSVELTEVRQLEAEFEARQSEIDRLMRETGTLENDRQRAAAVVQEIEEQFAKVGGRHWEARESLLERRGELDHARRESEQTLVALAATELPLALVPELLSVVQQRAASERQAAESAVVVRLLAQRDKTLLALLRKQRVDRAAVREVAEFLEADRARRAAPAADEAEGAASTPTGHPQLQLSDGARQLLDQFLARGRAERRASARQLMETLEEVRRRLEDVERSLAAAPDEETIGDVVERLKTASAELARFDAQIARLEKELARARGERDEIDKRLAQRRRRIVDEELRSEEDARLARLLVRTQATMQRYLQRATQRKIDRLAQLVGESFRYLLRKETLVRQVRIDPDTFAVTLYDDRGRGISKQRLSEGEKQIFAISVLWGLSRAAARPLPAIIDTPMARLDSTHRDKLVERYFPHASHQVLVLSTDTEIDRDYFDSLQPHIARAYHLNYDDRKKLTVAEGGYFWEL